MQHFNAFKSAIRWTEPFILALIAFQVFMMLLSAWVSRTNGSTAGRLIIMACIGIIVRSAEFLNRKGEQHWESFATQDYFDKRGVFVAVMLCAPLLLDCLFMLVMFVREAGQLLIQVKRKELSKKSKQPKSKNESKEATKETRKKSTKEE
jgi:transmembrane protein 18